MIDPKEILLNVLSTHSDAVKWNQSTFEHIRRVPNTKVGEVGQDFVEKLCQELGYKCIFPLNKKGERAKQNPWDIAIDEVQFELKTASEDVSGSFQFNHIRYHREYHAVMGIGISPYEIFFNLWSKADISTGEAGKLVSMEKKGNASYKLTKKSLDLYPIAEFDERLSVFLLNFKN